MSANPALVQQLSTYKARGMTPEAAASALLASASPASPVTFVQLNRASGGSGGGSTSAPAPIQPADLSMALTATYTSSITPAQMATILHQHFLSDTALDIAQAVQAGLPDTSQTDMYNALVGCGFSAADSQGAVNILYPATVTIQSNQAWQSTGVTVTGTQVTTLTYVSGQWTANPANGMCGPAGNSQYVAKPGYTLPGAYEGAMIAQIGSNTPFLVGTSAIAPAGQSGVLSLCINDDLHQQYGAGLTDNSGTMTFTVTTTAT